MTKISITIPSLYPDALGRTMDNIEDVTTGDYEVIVVSPFRFERENVVWVEETERKGCAAAHHIAAKAATGDFLVAFADDHVFVDGWDAVAIENFRRRESVFLQRGGHSSFEPAPFCLGLRHTYPQHVGTEFGITYPYFPLLRRSAVDRVGWIGPDYRSGFGDSDLGMRVWEAGGRVEFSEEGLIVVTSDDGRKPGALFTVADMALFISRWAPKYGRGWDLSHIRGFNLDVIPSDFPEFVDGNSIYHNDPEFARIVKERVAAKEAAK